MTSIPYCDRLRLAVQAGLASCTIDRYLAGKPVRSTTASRIVDAARRLKIALPRPELAPVEASR